MGLHPSERWMVRHIEEHLRKKDPDLDAFLAGRSALRHARVVIRAMYLVPPVLLALGLALDAIVPLVAGTVTAPLVPVIAQSLIRRGFPSSRHRRLRRPS
jgi:hypothetical protein